MKLDLTKLKRYSIHERRSKVSVKNLAECYRRGSSFADFLGTIPPILGGEDFFFLVERIKAAKGGRKKVIFGLGAHVLKVGLSSLMIQLLEGKFVDHVAVTGAFLIHDVELAMAGMTSENVGEQIRDGSFGMAEETSLFINGATKEGVEKGEGLALSVASRIGVAFPSGKGPSVLASCVENKVGISAHVAIGSDINHMHPEASGEVIGAGSLRDFHRFVEVVGDMEEGVYVNLGSAVILPEVFLKAVSIARNLGRPLKKITTAAMDFNRHYRVWENVVKRPTEEGGKGVYLVGHHEIMVPLLVAALIEDVHG